MKIPVRDERFNRETGKVETMDIDIVDELRQEAIAVFSMVVYLLSVLMRVYDLKMHLWGQVVPK